MFVQKCQTLCFWDPCIFYIAMRIICSFSIWIAIHPATCLFPFWVPFCSTSSSQINIFVIFKTRFYSVYYLNLWSWSWFTIHWCTLFIFSLSSIKIYRKQLYFAVKVTNFCFLLAYFLQLYSAQSLALIFTFHNQYLINKIKSRDTFLTPNIHFEVMSEYRSKMVCQQHFIMTYFVRYSFIFASQPHDQVRLCCEHDCVPYVLSWQVSTT